MGAGLGGGGGDGACLELTVVVPPSRTVPEDGAVPGREPPTKTVPGLRVGGERSSVGWIGVQLVGAP